MRGPNPPTDVAGQQRACSSPNRARGHRCSQVRNETAIRIATLNWVMFHKLAALVLVLLAVFVLALFAVPALFLITSRVSSRDATPPRPMPGHVTIAPETATSVAPGPAWTPAPCTANNLMASSAEVHAADGALSGSIYITGRRAMPACTLQGTPAVAILDANGHVLPVTQVSAPVQSETAEPVILGSTDRPYPAVVSIVWSNFCQPPTPPGPYSLRITLPDDEPLPLTPPLITADAQGYPAQVTSPPRCDVATAPSTLIIGPFRAFATTVPHDLHDPIQALGSRPGLGRLNSLWREFRLKLPLKLLGASLSLMGSGRHGGGYVGGAGVIPLAPQWHSLDKVVLAEWERSET